ncbi:hypothetical protein M885DRAFT_506033 [Pelagophyceae sp. CCMP2097]|nr:hypothetical protein M885DRAFT_506033 [Pelagophyceae sp. CCMP2097]
MLLRLFAVLACAAAQGQGGLPCVVKPGPTCGKKSRTSWISLVTNIYQTSGWADEAPEVLAMALQDASYNEIRVAQQLAKGSCRVTYPKCETAPAMACFPIVIKAADLKKNAKYSYTDLTGGNCKVVK